MAAASDSLTTRNCTASRLTYVGLLAVLLVAPFEVARPLVSLLNLKITNVETVVMAVLLLWLSMALLTRRKLLLKAPITYPALILMMVMLLSAWQAAHPSESLRFCGRFMTGISLYLLVFNEARSRDRTLGVMGLGLLPATLVAVLGLWEYQDIHQVSRWLSSFKTAPVFVGGQLRVSSTLQYPTIASMYLEIMFALGLGVLLHMIVRSRVRLAVPVFIALLLIAEGILVTQTRTGLIIIAMQIVFAAAVLWVKVGSDRTLPVLASLVVLITALAGHLIVRDSQYWLRLTASEEEWYRADFEVPAFLEFAAGEEKQVDVIVTNAGRAPWYPGDQSSFYISYHWLTPEGDEAVIFEGLRTPVSRPVQPGEKIQLRTTVLAPNQPGRYRLAWDAVYSEDRSLWFSSEQGLSAFSDASVSGPAVEGGLRPMRLLGTRFRIDRVSLWWAAGRMLWAHPLLGIGPDNFRLTYGPYLDLKEWDYSLHSNNMFLEFFVGTGFLGGMCFLWLFYRILAGLRDTWQTLRQDDLPVFLGLAGATLTITMHGMIDYFLGFTPTYVTLPPKTSPS